MTLIYPMAFIVFYIFALGVCNFITRKNAISKGGLHPGYFKNLDAASFQPPEFVIRMGRHYDHQFQVPILFLITCLVCIQLQVASPLALALAWAFIGVKLAHTYVHLGANKIIPRVATYMAGWLMVMGLWVMILVQVL